ncbi:MAG: tetratricopeptide repeat protein [Anaerolineales bacterium]|nr:tetratricopeptide repeat protein [Anaerolineales bacterium]
MTSLADILGRYVQKSLYSHGQLAQLSGLPKNSISNWLSGRVKKPRRWQDLVQLAEVLQLTAVEVDYLLTAVGHPPLTDLQRDPDPTTQTLLRRWQHPATSAPFQVIADLPTFVGRGPELSKLYEQLIAKKQVAVTSLQGMGGVGKTSLAARFAYQWRDHFPDGVLWAKLDTSDTLSLLAMFAGAYGVDATPYHTVDSRSALVRGLLADKRALLILDNAERSAQVAPLLPPTTGQCAVLVTTRHDLSVTDGWAHFVVRPFAPDSDEALALFARFLAADVVQEHEALLRHTADLVGHLPLALALVAGRLANDPRPAIFEAVYAALQNQETRLTVLQREARTVSVCFDLSYEVLSPAQQRVFRQLAVFGGDDFGVGAATAVCQTNLTATMLHLEQLTQLSLLQQARPQRYRLHPLLRDYACRRLAAHGEHIPAAKRMMAYYLALAEEAPTAVVDEMSNLLAVLNTAVELQLSEQLGEAIHTLAEILHEKGLWQALETYAQHAIELARPQQDYATQASMNSLLARTQWWRGENPYETLHTALDLARLAQEANIICDVLQELGAWHNRHSQPQQAEQCLREALAMAEAHDTVLAEKRIALHNNLGKALEYQHRLPEAVHCYQVAYRLAQEVGYFRAEVIIAGNLGRVYDDWGEWAQAVAYFTAGVEVGQKQGCDTAVMGVLGDWGYRALQHNYLAEAERCFTESLQISRRVNHIVSICVRLADLGEVARRRGQFATAQTMLEQALALGQENHLAAWLPIIYSRLAQVARDQNKMPAYTNWVARARQNQHLAHVEYRPELAWLSQT